MRIRARKVRGHPDLRSAYRTSDYTIRVYRRGEFGVIAVSDPTGRRIWERSSFQVKSPFWMRFWHRSKAIRAIERHASGGDPYGNQTWEVKVERP